MGAEELPVPPKDAPTTHLDEVVSARSDASNDVNTIPSTACLVEHVNVRTETQVWKLSSRGIVTCFRLSFEVISGGVAIISC